MKIKKDNFIKQEGFYYLHSEIEETPVLVHGYYLTIDEKTGYCRFVFGFNIHDGGGLVEFDDLAKDTEIEPVNIEIQKLKPVDK